ncbi:MAG: molybdopterin-binding protein [Gammaproteobacteria bacterium]|nr:molybdopterin-binding protein [Gammaproteobacteria bacterium]
MDKLSITACVIIIGNEILSGRTQDENLSFLGKRCDESGIHLTEARVIPDDEAVIVATINEVRNKHTYVFTTGGIGPTHDDISTAAIAKCFKVKIERNPAAVAAMEKYYEAGKLNEARLKMADIPAGAMLIDNPVSGAPGFQIENVFVLPGVPMIMQVMFDGLVDRLTGGLPILTDSIVTNLTEGTLAEGLSALQDKYPAVSIGSYPYFKQGKLGVNLVIRSTDKDALVNSGEDIAALVTSLQGRILG